MMGLHSSNTFTKLSGLHDFVRQDKQKMESKRFQEKRIQEIPLKMDQASNAGHAGRSRNGRQDDRGREGRRRTPSGTVPRKAAEVGACKDLEGHIFTIGSGNKGKDGDMLCTSMEKMATYIGTKYGNKAAQDWISGKKIVLLEPAYLQAILVRHAERVKATRERIELRLKSLRAEKMAIEAEIISAPTDRGLLKNCARWMTKLPRVTLSSKMRLR
jgi:hypothetical protein